MKKRIVMVNPGPKPRLKKPLFSSESNDQNDEDLGSFYRSPGEDRVIIEPDALKHIRHARGHLIAPDKSGGKPYLASAAMSLTLVRSPGYGTLGVDSSWRLYYDPDEIIYWPVDALSAVLEHEIWHLLKEHHRRAKDYGIQQDTGFRWNIAADTEIHSNEQLLSDVSKVPNSDPAHPAKWGLKPKQTVEFYYENIPFPEPEDPRGKGKGKGEGRGEGKGEGRGEGKGEGKGEGRGEGKGEGKGKGRGEGSGEGSGGMPVDWNEYMDPTRGVSGSCADGLERPNELPSTDETINRAEEAVIRRDVARAVQGAKSRGDRVGDWVAEWASMELAPPKIDWRDLLRNAIEHAIQYHRGNMQYTWSRLSRRQAASPDFLLPGMHSPVPEVAVVLDTSGSMFTAAYGKAGKDAAREGAQFVTLLQEAMHEVGGILEEHGNTIGVNILATDMVVQSAQRVYDIEDILVIGGGGTDMGVGLNALALLEPQPNVAICLTDGYTPWPIERPEVDAEYIVGIVGSTEANLAKSWPPPAWADEVIYIDEL